MGSIGSWAISIWFHFICVPVTIVCIGDGFDSEIQSYIAWIKWSVFAIETNVDVNIQAHNFCDGMSSQIAIGIC